MFLGRYERKYAHRLPRTELRSRALQKLARASASSRMHLAVLVHRVVIQALLDYGKERAVITSILNTTIPSTFRTTRMSWLVAPRPP